MNIFQCVNVDYHQWITLWVFFTFYRSNTCLLQKIQISEKQKVAF